MSDSYTCEDCLFCEIVVNNCDKDLICWASRLSMNLRTRRRICRHFKLAEMYKKRNPIGFSAMQSAIADSQRTTARN